MPDAEQPSKKQKPTGGDEMDLDNGPPPVLSGEVVLNLHVSGVIPGWTPDRGFFLACAETEGKAVIVRAFAPVDDAKMDGDRQYIELAVAPEIGGGGASAQPKRHGAVVLMKTMEEVNRPQWMVARRDKLPNRLYGWIPVRKVFPIPSSLPRDYEEQIYITTTYGPLTDQWAEEVCKQAGACVVILARLWT
jgi:hypothetical protein